MPSKKQRRRRAKERRHEYEIVYVDDEGHEVEPPPEKAEPRRSGKKDGKPAPKARSSAQKRPVRGAARVVPPPSWKRALKRGGIFAPFMLLTLYLLGGKKSGWGPVIIQTAYLLVLFVPFSYLVDRAMHRRYLKQTGQLPEPSRRRRQS